MADEELARALQAMDNGLRRRKRSSISFPEERKPKSRSKSDTPSKSDASGKQESPNKTETPARKPRGHAHAPASVEHDASSPAASSNGTAASPASMEPNESAQVVPKEVDVSTSLVEEDDTFCLGCGKTFLQSSALEHATPSKDNHLICSSCFVRYSLAPFQGHAPVRASPSHRCEGHGCAVTFITAERLKDHCTRVHGIAPKVS